jgi:enoyl-CoA hydratase/carnithine racemase
MSAELLAERTESTLTLILSNPGARNALHPDMYAAGIEALESVERDASIRTVLLTGADNFFCAGGDLHRLLKNRAKEPSAQADNIDMLGELIGALRSCSKLVIAAVEGAAAGAGFSLALACDLLVAADNAKFVMAYVNVGLTPDGGGSWFLSRALPRALAMEILVEGKAIGAQRLYELGLVNRLSKPGQAREQALRWAEELGHLSPHAVTRIKTLVSLAGTQTLDAHLVSERDTFVAALHHGDALEGINAFLDKRAAVYK